MGQFIPENKKIIFVFVCILVILLFFMTLFLMRAQLKEQAIENYCLIAEEKRQAAEELINQCLVKATMLSDLQEMTYSEYMSGIEALQNLDFSLCFALRYIEDKPLFIWQKDEADIKEYIDLPENPATAEYRIIKETGGTEVVVYSPVFHENKAVGYDILALDISEKLAELSGEGFIITFLSPENSAAKNFKPGIIYEKYELNQLNYTCVVKPVKGKELLLIAKLSGEVFSCVTEMTVFGLAAALLFIVLHLGLIKMVIDVIREISCSRETYMNYANYDFLTGAYTRVFFNHWIKGRNDVLNECKLVVAMLDVDYLKMINDTFGHKAGDDVLKFISGTLANSLRKHDLVVRFGGDEFIILFEGLNTEKIHKILNRIKQQIADGNPFDFDVSISYGLEEVEALETIYDSIKKADEKMYANKRRNKLETNSV